MKETRTINNVVFEVKHVGDEIWKTATQVIKRVRPLDECYSKPSMRKQHIYREWVEWAYATEDIYTFDVDTYNTYNTNIFTLSGVIEYINGSVEVVHITPTRHILYTV